MQLAGQGDTQFARRLALLFAAVIGERSMRQYYVSEPVLAIAAGIILFLVALKTIMEQFRSTVPAPQQNLEPSLGLAISPLAFPAIVTPYGVAAVIICMALTPDFLTKGAIFGALFCLMLVNLAGMLFAKKILKYAGMQLLGMVVGVIQVALGLQIVVAGLRGLASTFSR